MGRYNIHPAQGGGHYHDEKHYKDRRPTLDQQKERKRLKKVEKETEKGILVCINSLTYKLISRFYLCLAF